MRPSPLHPNETPRDASRRTFLVTLSRVAAVGVGLHLIGCLDEDPVSTGTPVSGGKETCPPAKTAADRAGTISANHGHVAVVTTAQQDAGLAFNLDIRGSSPHGHVVALTAQDVETLKSGAQLVKTTVGNDGTGHSHTVTFAAVPTSIRKPC